MSNQETVTPLSAEANLAKALADLNDAGERMNENSAGDAKTEVAVCAERLIYVCIEEAPALIERLEKAETRVEVLEAANCWIPVGERLPEFTCDSQDSDDRTLEISDDVCVLINGSPLVAYRSRYAGSERWCWVLEWLEITAAKENVTHWHPLPELPKGAADVDKRV